MLADLDQGNTITSLNIDKWLNNIKQTYTTLEQVAVHDGSDQVKDNKNDEITFF